VNYYDDRNLYLGRLEILYPVKNEDRH
jgi:hypothetical protein